jgi:hypothetical protein
MKRHQDVPSSNFLPSDILILGYYSKVRSLLCQFINFIAFSFGM